MFSVTDMKWEKNYTILNRKVNIICIYYICKYCTFTYAFTYAYLTCIHILRSYRIHAYST